VFGCGAVFAGDRGVAALGGMGWVYGFTTVGLCEAVKVSTAKQRVLWLGASGQNSKDGRRAGVVFGGSKPSQAGRILGVAGRFGAASSVDASARRGYEALGRRSLPGLARGDCLGRAPGARTTFRQRGARCARAPVLPSFLTANRGSAGSLEVQRDPNWLLILTKGALNEACLHSLSSGASRPKPQFPAVFAHHFWHESSGERQVAELSMILVSKI
jgi:hypothetical protein